MRIALFVATLALVATGCSKPAAAPQGPATATIALSDARVQLPVVPGRPAAAYFTLTVPDDAQGTLVGISADHFARAELHQSKMEGGAMTMSPVDRLPLTPGKPVVFAPGGYHVMLFDADGTLKPGGTTRLVAKLADGRTIQTTAKLTAAGGDTM